MHATEQPFSASGCTSARKAEANRANAQKSTGPKSSIGKARSSRNATRHGLLADTAALLAKPNQEIETLRAQYRSDFRPAGVHEEMLVSELAVADWRIKQITRIESGVLWLQMQECYTSVINADRPIQWTEPQPMACGVCGIAHEPEVPEDSEPEPPQLSETSADMQTLLMGAAWATNPATFALVVRYQSQARRDYFRALRQLEQVRTGKAGYLPDEPPSRIGKTIDQEPEPAANETKPNAAPAKAAAATASSNGTNPTGNGTKPIVPNATVKSGTEPTAKTDGKSGTGAADSFQTELDRRSRG